MSHPALAEPATLARYRRRCRRTDKVALPLTAVGAVTILLPLLLMDTEPSEDGGLAPAVALAVCGGLALIAGLTLSVITRSRLRMAQRIEAVLAHHPWVRRGRFHYRERGVKTPTVDIEADGYGPAGRYNLYAGVDVGHTALGKLRRSTGGPLLVAGDPRGEAVVTTPDLHELCVIKPYRTLG